MRLAYHIRPVEPFGRARSGDESWRPVVLASALFALATALNVFAAALMALGGILCLAASLWRPDHPFTSFTDLRLHAAVVAVALVGVVVPSYLVGPQPGWVSVALPATALVLAIAHVFTGSPGWRRVAASAGLLCVASLFAGALIVRASQGVGLDVMWLHVRAAESLARGGSPYDETVSVPNGGPGAPGGGMIVGYPYPPIAAASYAFGTWVGHDPRWTSLAAWTVVLLSIAWLVVSGSYRSHVPLLLLAAMPGWTMLLQSGWTEPLSLALLAAGAAAWHHPATAGLAIGAGLSSKQYFVAALPLLVLYRGWGWRRRNTVAVAALVVALLPAIVWGAADAWRSLVLFHLENPVRADSSNLPGVLRAAGVQWTIPAWSGLVLAGAAVTVAARRAAMPAEFWRVLALGLAVLFMLSRQAMPNYWYLVAVVSLLGSQSRSSQHPSES